MGLLFDVAIVLAYFGAISAIGLYMGRRERSLKDFALGGRQIPWWAVMASIIAAETSAATFLGAPTEGFKKQSLAYALLTLGVILGRFVVAKWFLRPYFRYKVYTVYDYLEVRFGKATKTFVSVLFLVMRTLASGTRLFIPSIVMVLAWQVLMNGGQPVVVSAKPVESVTPYLVAIALLTIVTAVYTVRGGIKAVIWTDVVQAALMFGSALLAIGFLLRQIGGLDELARLVPKMASPAGYFATGFDGASVAEWRKSAHVPPNAQMGMVEWIRLVIGSDYTLVSALIASTAMNMAAFGTDQDMCQRLLTAETAERSRKSLMTAAFMDIPIAVVFTFIGILLFAFYQLDPSMKPKADADVFASYILNVMPSGLRGVVLAGVFATAMGSLSAALNALATSAANDFYLPFVAKPKGYGEERVLAAARAFTIVFSVAMFVVAGMFAWVKVNHPEVGIIPVVLGVAGYILGPMLGVFLLGIFTLSRGSDEGNIAGLAAGLLATTILGDLPGKISPAWHIPLPIDVSFTWFALIGAAATLAVGVWWKTPSEVLVRAEERAKQAESNDAPLALRGEV